MSDPQALVRKVFGDYTIKEYTIRGITVRSLDSPAVTIKPATVRLIVDEIEKANNWINDPAYQVKQCFITNARNQFWLYKNAPIIILDHLNAEPSTATHEMGHAIFNYYRHSPLAPPDAVLKLVDLFLALSQTKKIAGQVIFHDRKKNENYAAGLWLADPPNWSRKPRLSEHPWDDADELFASMREAFLIDKIGLNGAIKKFTKQDPTIKIAADGLLAMIASLQKEENLGVALPENHRLRAAAELNQKKYNVLILEDADSFKLPDAGILFRMTVDPGEPDKPSFRPSRPINDFLDEIDQLIQPLRQTGFNEAQKKDIKFWMKEGRLREGQIRERQVREQRQREQRQRDQQLRDQQLRGQRTREQQLRDQQAREQRLRDQQQREQQLRGQQLREKQMRDQRLRDQQLRAQQVREQQQREQRLREQRLREQQIRDRLREQQQAQIKLQNQLKLTNRPKFHFVPKTQTPQFKHRGGYKGTMFQGIFNPTVPKPFDFQRTHRFPNGRTIKTPWERTGGAY